MLLSVFWLIFTVQIRKKVEKCLTSCKIGEQLVVSEILSSPVTQILLEMGVYIGKELQILYTAPLGDPIAIQLGDYVLSMRKSEAESILVRATPIAK